MTYFRKTQWMLWLVMWAGIPVSFILLLTLRVWTRQLMGDALKDFNSIVAWQLAWHIPVFLMFMMLPRLNKRIRRHRQREHEELNYRICLECEHSLHRLPITGACPECGLAYDNQLANLWKVRWEKPLATRNLIGPLKMLNISALCLATLLVIAILFCAIALRFFLK